MSSNFSMYRSAERRIRRGWAHGAWTDEHGGVCLIEGLAQSMGLSRRALPKQVIDDLDAELSKYRSYRWYRGIIVDATENGGRLLRKLQKTGGYIDGADPRQHAMILWNDSPWRKRDEVVRLLGQVADTTELKWRRSETVRLTIEVELLKTRISALDAEVKRLKAENTSLRKRLANRVALRDSQAAMQQLSDELDATWQELQAASNSGI